MKKHVIALLATASVAAHAEFFSGNDLLGKMNGEFGDKMVALGYVMGVFDVARGAEHCPPDNITAGQVRDMVKSHLETNPSVRHILADLQVRYVLKNAWPCAKKNNGSNL